MQPTIYITTRNVQETNVKKHKRLKKKVCKPVTTHLSFLIDDGHCVLQLYVVEKTGEKDVGNTDQTVVFLLVKKRVSPAKI